jgi:SAM-dependent methyltransferase
MPNSLFILKQASCFLPKTIRNGKKLQNLRIRILEKLGTLNDIYSQRYYQTLVEPYARKSVLHMAASIIGTFHPQSVIDIGCGSGALLVALRKAGIHDLIGLDASTAGLEIAAARGLDTRLFDVTSDIWNENRQFDLAVSMETAEHLPKKSADRYIALLCSLAPIIVFTAAPPGQGGIGHRNEQPQSYWKDRFAAHGFQSMEKVVADWQQVWKTAGVADFYTKNLIIFQKDD